MVGLDRLAATRTASTRLSREVRDVDAVEEEEGQEADVEAEVGNFR